MALPQFKLMFDVGVGSSKLTEIPRLLLTHGHLDHACGVPYYVSQRSLRRLPPPDIHCPPEMVSPLTKILDLWSEIEGYRAEYRVHPVELGVDVPLQSNFFFRAVPSVHRVPSNGYVIVEKRTKLRKEFLSLPPQEIARLKKERDDMFYTTFSPLVAFSGDTQIEFVLENEIVRQSKILFLECTYIDSDRPVERARKWGHTHLDEIAKHADAFEDVEHLVLIHFSPRYRFEQVRRALRDILPDKLLARTIPFPPRAASRRGG